MHLPFLGKRATAINQKKNFNGAYKSHLIIFVDTKNNDTSLLIFDVQLNEKTRKMFGFLFQEATLSLAKWLL